MGNLSAHFDVEEFACKCGKCSAVLPAPRLVEALEALRESTGVPVIITSGVRCHAHDMAQLSTHRRAPTGYHRLTLAADVIVPGMTPREVAAHAQSHPALCGFFYQRHGPRNTWTPRGGVGVGATFTHLDVRAGRAARWDYNPPRGFAPREDA